MTSVSATLNAYPKWDAKLIWTILERAMPQSHQSAISRWIGSRLRGSFVTKCDQDPAQSRLANAMIQMAQQLDLEVVAEGVETIGEQCHMVDLGVDALQGYSIAHPLAPEKVVAWMEGYFKKQRRKAAV